MATNLNVVCIAGNIVKDCEQPRKEVAPFTLAVNRTVKDPDGTYKETAGFFDCVIYGKYADAMASLLKKGKHVTVSGELQQKTWMVDEQKRSRVVIVANKIELDRKTE